MFYSCGSPHGYIMWCCCANGDEIWLSIKFGIFDYRTSRTCHGCACSFPRPIIAENQVRFQSVNVGFVVDKVALGGVSL
jgi:hypothetical protein